jgi:hypothetical protein
VPEENHILRLPREMAMARSGVKGMWNSGCEGGTYLYTQAKMGGSFMFQTWRRGLVCLLVLASLPFLAPLIIVSMVVGGVFLVPVLCGGIAYYALFRPASLASAIKWFRSPKSVLGSEPQSTELVMEDLALHGRDGRAQEEDNQPSASLRSQEFVEARSPLEESGEHLTDYSYPVAETQDFGIEEEEYNAFHFDDPERERAEDQSMTVESLDRISLGDEFPILEITASGIPWEELNLPADKEELSQVVGDDQQEQSEEPEQLEEGLPEEAPEEGLPDDPAVPHVVTEDESPLVQEKGIEIPLIVSEPVLGEEEVPEVEEDVGAPSLESEVSMMIQHSLPEESEPVELVSSVEDVPAVAEAAHVLEAISASSSVEESGAKDVEVPEAPIGEMRKMVDPMLEFSTPTMDQQFLPVDSEPVELASSVMDIPAIAESAPLQEDAALVEEFDAKEAEASEASMEKEKEVFSEPVDLASHVADVPDVEEVALMEEASLVEVSASTEEALVEKVEDPETSVVEDKELEAHVTALKEVNVEEQPVVLTPAQEGLASEAEASIAEPELTEEVKVEEQIVVLTPAQEGLASEAEAPIAEPELTEEVKAEPAAAEAVKEHSDVELSSVVSEPVTGEKETLVVAEDVEAAPMLEFETLVVEEKSLLKEEAASVEDDAPMGEGVVEKGEESETPVVDVKDIKEPVAALQETLSEEGATSEAEAPFAEVKVTKEAEAGPTASEVLAEEDQIVQEKFELPLVESEPIAEAHGLEPEAPVIAEKSLPAEEAVQVQQPEAPVVEEKEADTHVAESSIEEEVDKAPEAEVLINEPEAPVEEEKEADTHVAESSIEEEEVDRAPEAEVLINEPEASVVEEKEADTHVAESSIEEEEEEVDKAPEAEVLINEPEVTKDAPPGSIAAEEAPGVREVELPLTVSEEREAPGVEESLAVPKLEPEASVVAAEKKKKKKKRKKKKHDSSFIDKSSLESGVSSSVAEKPLPVQEVQVEAAPVEETLVSKVGEPEASAVEKIEGADATTLHISSRADSGISSERDVFPILKPLNVVQSKDSPHDEPAEESVSILTSSRAQRRISFEDVRANEEVNIGAPSAPSHRTDAQGTKFVFKSRLGRGHRSLRHSAPDFLATQTWVGEAPMYSPQDSFQGHKRAKYERWPEFEGTRPARTSSASVGDSAELHMGEFESLLQSWQERGKATHSPTSVSPSGSPAEIGRQIREEISTIQKIIGQEIPPQYSLWKEVETLSQIVGMELPYMGDVSDLTKARHGLDLLKVVVGIKWT